MEEVFKKANTSKVINVDGENFTNFSFVDDVALSNEKNHKTNGKPFKQFEHRKPEVGRKIHKRKTKHMTNYAGSEDTRTDQEKELKK